MKQTALKQRGIIRHQADVYGTSVLGNKLEVFLPVKSTELLIFAGIHGEESDTTILLSKALRSLSDSLEHCAVILAANPDGLLHGTRGNANGVDLNRNFPASNWTDQAVCHRWHLGGEQLIELSSGHRPASEPETQALLRLIEKLSPKQIIALHSPLACIDDPLASPLAQKMAAWTEMPLVPDVGSPTPGSFGSWCAEIDLPVITYELPSTSVWTMLDKHLSLLECLLLDPTLENTIATPKQKTVAMMM